jgi:hypothetical protein
MLEIPTTCLTMKRWVFEKYGPFLERTFSSDSAFGWTVSKHGCHPLFLPTIRVSHINITSLTVLLGHRVRRGACFARVRVAEQKFSWLRRIAYVPLTPVLPAILFGRVLRLVVNDGFHLSRFVGTCPLVFLGFVAWSWGELLGYLSTPQPHATS